MGILEFNTLALGILEFNALALCILEFNALALEVFPDGHYLRNVHEISSTTRPDRFWKPVRSDSTLSILQKNLYVISQLTLLYLDFLD